MAVPAILRISNLLSLSRIVLAPLAGYFLWLDTDTGTVWALILLVVAGITDGLDGIVARRSGHVDKLGITLDPVCDKIFALLLVVFLVLYRSMPIWLAAVIVGRDVLIAGAGMLLLRGRDISLPSNLTGKYAFTAIVILLGSYIIRFDFGITLMTWVTLILIVASLINYARTFVRLRQGEEPAEFKDTPTAKWLRLGIFVLISAVYVYRLFSDMLL